MAGFKWDKFAGMRPLATDLRLGSSEASYAQGIDFRRGVLRPAIIQRVWNALYDPYVTLGDLDTVPASLFRFRDRFNNDEHWMYWMTDVDVVPGPVENVEQRHYYTGDGLPKMFTKDGITDSTPPYPEAADAKFPKTWYFLGVPAPDGAAPTIDGESYTPPDSAKSGVITGFTVPNMVIRYHPKRPHRIRDQINAYTNGMPIMEGNPNTHMDSSEGAMIMEVMTVGTRVKVTEIIDGSNVRVVGTEGNGYFEPFESNYDNPVPVNRMDERWVWDEAETLVSPTGESPADYLKVYRKINGKENDICWTYHVPDGAVLLIGTHKLKVGDVLRVISATAAMQWSTPTRLMAGVKLNATNNGAGRLRGLFDPSLAPIVFTGDLTYFVERDGREFDPTIDDVQVEKREPTTRAYVYTYVTALGEEGPPSKPTEPFTLAQGDSVAVEGFLPPPTDHRNITIYRLYRTNTGTQDTAFQFVADIPVADTSYTDGLPDDELGEVLQSETWDLPPPNMVGIVAMPNEFLAGFFDNVLCFSEAGFPHAWPVDYRMPLDSKIMAIKVIGGSLIVATRGAPYVVAGAHPRQMAGRREEETAPCIDKRSMADCGDIAIYASTDGLIAASPGSFRNLLGQHYTRDQWLAVVGDTDAPSRAIRGWYVNGQYLLTCFSTAKNPATNFDVDQFLLFDFRTPERLDIVVPEMYPSAAFNDPTDGELYYIPAFGLNAGVCRIVDNEIPPYVQPILRWDYFHPESRPALAPEGVFPRDRPGDGSAGNFVSRMVMFPRPIAPSVARVVCRRVPNTANNYFFGWVDIRLYGRRYDASNDDNDFGPERLLCEEIVILGDSDGDTWVGDHSSRPFRLAPNLLVDAVRFQITVMGSVEVEAVYVGESFDDLIALDGRG